MKHLNEIQIDIIKKHAKTFKMLMKSALFQKDVFSNREHKFNGF